MRDEDLFKKYGDQVLSAKERVLGMLKPFQRDTVKHIDRLFSENHNRVLVSDEVGLGKTLIAKGVVATTAELRLKEGDPFFKVVYVCSNGAIVNQNLSKLSIDDELVNRVDASQSRLSMQHYLAYKNERAARENGSYIQLIPMTPGTSFKVTNGGGTAWERALIFAVLRHYAPFADIEEELEELLVNGAETSWKLAKGFYCSKTEVDSDENAGYRAEIAAALARHQAELQEVHDELAGTRTLSDVRLIGKLRSVFARISVERLDPDLVIMDEFQRFRSLIDSEEDDELGIIAKSFLKSPTREEPIRVLLLSATPFKAFTTQAEGELFFGESSSDDFLRVVDFLQEGKGSEFKDEWTAYGSKLEAYADKATDLSTVSASKSTAETGLREVMARTERIGLAEYRDAICDKTTLVPADRNDIASYLTAINLFRRMGIQDTLPIDYVESCPFVLSYLKGYRSGERLLKAFKDNKKAIPYEREDGVKQSRLWVRWHAVNDFKKLSIPNSRMRKLVGDVFDVGKGKTDASSLLWIPASRPYYEVAWGPYASTEGFSKTLVFSAWTMVPRMMSTLISYEDERRSVWEKYGKSSNFKYFDPKAEEPNEGGDDNDDPETDRRLPSKRLRPVPAARTGSVLLMYPSRYLANAVSWPEFAADMTAERLIEAVSSAIGERLREIIGVHDPSNRDDHAWYLKATLLLERNFGVDPEELFAAIEGYQGLSADSYKLVKEWREIDRTPMSELGGIPDDLANVLARVAVGSPAVCAMRTFRMCRESENVQLLGYRFTEALLRRLNTPSATLAVEAGMSKVSHRSHWSRVLDYCIQGNFQSVLDEYGHQIGFQHSGDFMCEEMIGGSIGRFRGPSTYTMHSQYDVDYLWNARHRASGEPDRPMKMRTAYAAAFLDDEGGGSNDNRRENLRKAFNSPFRPFVLCSTSVGQEGLDFHAYCRKVVHWNLPSNPVDLEQREGRINRYEGLAVRQNVAKAYDVPLQNGVDIWRLMFDLAETDARSKACGPFAELVPHWGLGSYDPELQIERRAYLRTLGQSAARYQQLIDVLVRYRAVLGQPRQEELLEKLGDNFDEQTLRELFLDLSPFNYEHEDWEGERQ